MLKITPLFIALTIAATPMYASEAPQTPPQTQPESKIKKKMKQSLDFIQIILEDQYAPLEWKRSQFGWDLEKEIKIAKSKIDKILPSPSIKDYQVILRNFFNTTQDQHVSAVFFSTETASLPFTIKTIKGKQYINYIDKRKLSSGVYKLAVGDEVVMFDDKPMADAMKEFLETEFGGRSTSATDISLADFSFTKRSGKGAFKVPSGQVMVGVRGGETGKVNIYQLAWEYTPELISSAYEYDSDFDGIFPGKQIEKQLSKQMISPYFEMLKNSDLLDNGNPHNLGGKKSFIPTLGQKIWQSRKSDEFYAYIFENTEGKNIAYLRIADYRGGKKEAENFAKIIIHLDDNSDALIIDQVNNPGGKYFYLCALASMLTEKPLYSPKDRITITQKDVALAVKYIPILSEVSSDAEAQIVLGDSWSGYPVTHQMAQFFLEYFRFVVDSWNDGKKLTAAAHLYGVDKINPSTEACYTKPILILVNELSISCGDFFPAIMQDNKRATIMGSQTAGAGGFVTAMAFPNQLGLVGFRYTGSIAERLHKNPIENLGVNPDIVYQITEADLKNNFRGYLKAINKVVNEVLLKQEATPN